MRGIHLWKQRAPSSTALHTNRKIVVENKTQRKVHQNTFKNGNTSVTRQVQVREKTTSTSSHLQLIRPFSTTLSLSCFQFHNSLQARPYRTSGLLASNDSDSEVIAPKEQILDLNVFHTQADEILEDFCDRIEDTLSNEFSEEFDATYSDGILKIKLGEKGTYVLNKQTPNRQIWFSSPVSGPKRYNYDTASKTWRNTRDGHDLREILARELTQLTGVQCDLSPKAE